MSVKRDVFVKYIDTFLLGKINEQHLSFKLNYDDSRVKVTMQPPTHTQFKTTTIFKHPFINGETGGVILKNADELKKTLSIMEDDINFKVEGNHNGIPLYLHANDTKRKISFRCNSEYEDVRDIVNIPVPTLTCHLNNDFINSYSKLISIFKPTSVRIANSDGDEYNILKFEGENLSGNVELRLDCEFIDTNVPKKNNHVDVYDPIYLLKILEQGKSITDDVILDYAIATQSNDIPMSALFFDFENSDIHAKYVLTPLKINK